MARLGNWSQNWRISKSQKETEPGVQKGKRFRLVLCHIRCKCSMETTRNMVEVKLGIKFMQLVEKLIGLEVTVTDRGSECHLTFVMGRLHIAE